jgi:hypothetical protein
MNRIELLFLLVFKPPRNGKTVGFDTSITAARRLAALPALLSATASLAGVRVEMLSIAAQRAHTIVAVAVATTLLRRLEKWNKPLVAVF